MPTGYTHPLEKQPDMAFRDFALRCTRAMGVCMALRDEPLDVPPPEKAEAPDYYRDSLDKARQTKEEVLARDAKAWRMAHSARRTEAQQSLDAARARAATWRDSCARLIRETAKWAAPTEEHEGLRKFMLEQLKTTIKFDGTDPDPKWYAVADFAEWKRAEIEDVCAKVARAEADLRNAEDRAATATEWLRALRASLVSP